jgi:hypothetical protein
MVRLVNALGCLKSATSITSPIRSCHYLRAATTDGTSAPTEYEAGDPA